MTDTDICEFQDLLYPILSYSNGENVSSRVQEFEKLLTTHTIAQALDIMNVENLMTRATFINGASNLIITGPCIECVRGHTCLKHNIWKDKSAQPDTTSNPMQLQDRDPHVPPKDRRSTRYDSSHLPRVNDIGPHPTRFGVPIQLSAYDSIPSFITLESNQRVRVSMGAVYKALSN